MNLLHDGAMRFGRWNQALDDVDIDRFRVYGPLTGFRLKQWQHFCIVHPKLSVTVAVVDCGYLKLGWVQVVDRKTGDRFEHHRRSPLLDAHCARSLHDERTWLRSPGLSIEIHNYLAGGGHRVRVQADRLGSSVDVDVWLPHDAEPCVVSLPVGRGRAMYSHKVPLSVQGRIRAGDYDHDAAGATAILDIHKAHYPWHTWWKWCTFAGSVDGRRVAVNLTQNVIEDAERWHENALWVDGKLYDLGPSTFDTSGEVWRATAQGVELRFDGEGERREALNVGLVQSKFRQRYGIWSGTIHHPDVGELSVEGWGLAEDHVARW